MTADTQVMSKVGAEYVQDTVEDHVKSIIFAALTETHGALRTGDVTTARQCLDVVNKFMAMLNGGDIFKTGQHVQWKHGYTFGSGKVEFRTPIGDYLITQDLTGDQFYISGEYLSEYAS